MCIISAPTKFHLKSADNFSSQCLNLKQVCFFFLPLPSVVWHYLCFYVHINIPNVVNTVEKEPIMLGSALLVEGRSNPFSVKLFWAAPLASKRITDERTLSVFSSHFLDRWVGSP